jgi:alkanesulfonate monooxygenase SsuD/methylene tetrahydromethanopterin reductase-like flavin-dependent oxidoreductase (luciferase family)
MKLGAATVVTDESIRPDVLAKALEDRGFDSLVVAAHSHIPTKPESETLQLLDSIAALTETYS